MNKYYHREPLKKIQVQRLNLLRDYFRHRSYKTRKSAMQAEARISDALFIPLPFIVAIFQWSDNRFRVQIPKWEPGKDELKRLEDAQFHTLSTFVKVGDLF